MRLEFYLRPLGKYVTTPFLQILNSNLMQSVAIDTLKRNFIKPFLLLQNNLWNILITNILIYMTQTRENQGEGAVNFIKLIFYMFYNLSYMNKNQNVKDLFGCLMLRGCNFFQQE